VQYSMRLVSLRHVLLLVVGLAGCMPGHNVIDEAALQSRVKEQKAHPTPVTSEFTPTHSVAPSAPEYSSFQLGPDDVVRISVLNDSDLNTVQPVRPDGKIEFFPTGDMQAAGRTVKQLHDEIVSRLRSNQRRPYRVGIQDVLDVKVYGHEELNTTQTVGPDGTISILPGGTIRAVGRTVDELREEISKRVSSIVQDPVLNVSVKQYKSRPLFIADPLVNVVVDEVNSRRVSILGAVRIPGIIKLRTATTLLDGISQAGGPSDDADLRQSIVVRDGRILPVNLERLFKQGDITQNVYLQPNTSVFIASIRFNSVYVIGDVRREGKVTWDGTLNLMEAVGLAGGFGRDARVSHVLIISGGIVVPTLKMVDAGGIIYRGELDRNIALARGDIVYVPTLDLATTERYFEFALKVLQPILAAESAVVLGSSVNSIVHGKPPQTGTSINLNP
jgi:polysaccharide export outer membrane protein